MVYTVPVAVATPDGRLVTIWNGLDATTQTPSILAAVRSADGAWGATRTLSNSPQALRVNALYALRLVTDGAGKRDRALGPQPERRPRRGIDGHAPRRREQLVGTRTP